MANVKQIINDPSVCSSEEGKQMWRAIEEWEKQNRNSADKGENENQSSE